MGIRLQVDQFIQVLNVNHPDQAEVLKSYAQAGYTTPSEWLINILEALNEIEKSAVSEDHALMKEIETLKINMRDIFQSANDD